jgi:restriction system protein
VGRSGDGGIDGIINEDKLGLDVVYVQAKRWEGQVSSPVVNAFVGALVGRNASKGVLITTSSFSQPAITFAQAVAMKVVLIDGARLADLMIEHGIGVTDTATYTLKRIDEDYFEG